MSVKDKTCCTKPNPFQSLLTNVLVCRNCQRMDFKGETLTREEYMRRDNNGRVWTGKVERISP